METGGAFVAATTLTADGGATGAAEATATPDNAIDSEAVTAMTERAKVFIFPNFLCSFLAPNK
ncbi:hypothetical protein GCM10009628_24610 [Paeniglutamicibacter kerguelensis]